jgi:hypothetical protein
MVLVMNGMKSLMNGIFENPDIGCFNDKLALAKVRKRAKNVFEARFNAILALAVMLPLSS